jgi:Protein of unknown function (DUF402)
MATRPGDSIVYQDVWRGAVWAACPLTFVHETPDLIAAYRGPGGVGFTQPERDGVTGSERLLAALDAPNSPTRPVVWRTNRRLLLMRPGEEHAVSLFWRDADDEFLGWYVDLLAPIRRTAIGIASMDLVLDIVIAPDLSSWHWKDEAEFAEAARRGLFSPELVARARANAERCLDDLAARAWPYDGDWPSWRPDPGWSVPSMAAGWDRVG